MWQRDFPCMSSISHYWNNKEGQKFEEYTEEGQYIASATELQPIKPKPEYNGAVTVCKKASVVR